jgi:YD repeat-containing protein
VTAKRRAGLASIVYSYDADDRLTGVVYQDGSRSTYTYHGDGLRRSAQEPGGPVWDGTDYLGEY